MSLLVEIEKQLGNFHLDVRFQAETETLALLGASGCGKSMTLKCIAGIMTPDRGRIVLNGRVLFDSEARIDLPPQQRPSTAFGWRVWKSGIPPSFPADSSSGWRWQGFSAPSRRSFCWTSRFPRWTAI